MSKNDIYKVSKSIVTQLRGQRRFNGEILRGSNKQTIIGSQRIFVLALLSLRAQAGIRTSRAKIESLINAINLVDVKDYLSVLSWMDTLLLQNKQPVDLPDNSMSPKDDRTWGFFVQLKKRVDCFYRKWFHDNDESAFAALHQLFALQSRVSLQLDELRQIAYDAWLETECKIFPSPQGELESAYIRKWFPADQFHDFWLNFIPGHGSGAVAENAKSIAQKYQLMVLDTSLTRLLKLIGYPFDNTITPFKSLTVDKGAYRVPCEVVFVNKTWKTYRTISKERVTAMFLQQGMGRCIDAFLQKRRTAFSRYYSVNSENKNRQLAWLGSLHGCYDTIDLSAASDSVTWKLVKMWFRHTCLEHGIRLTRTKFVSVRDPRTNQQSVYEQQKFAPMGSRVCFPVETIVFGAIAAAACDRAGLPDDSEEYPNFVVYGDDIVIRHEATQLLLDRLTELGFVPNRAKSYWDFSSEFCFRESCGIECLNGIDVTPIRLSRNGFKGFPNRCSTEEDYRSVAGLVSLANQCKSRLPFVQHYIIDMVMDLGIPIAWDADGSRGFISSRPKYVGEIYQHRYNSDYQYYEVLVFAVMRVPYGTAADEIQSTPMPSEYPSFDEYKVAWKNWTDQYERWYLERDLELQLLWHRLAALEKRATSSSIFPDDEISQTCLHGYKQLTLRKLWIPDYEYNPGQALSETI